MHLVFPGNTSTIQTFVPSVYKFHVYLHVQLILHDLGVSLPNEDGFSNVKNAYIKSDHYSVSDDYGVNSNKTRMYGG